MRRITPFFILLVLAGCTTIDGGNNKAFSRTDFPTTVSYATQESQTGSSNVLLPSDIAAINAAVANGDKRDMPPQDEILQHRLQMN